MVPESYVRLSIPGHTKVHVQTGCAVFLWLAFHLPKKPGDASRCRYGIPILRVLELSISILLNV